ncbi:MAG: 50S ribosomal protein L23 [Rhodobacteraceae bacterium]|nr:50S ribosomal protein L23 [Paracoccaceae bacterium]
MKKQSDKYDIIRRPIITEKATMASESGTLAFEVSMGCNKSDIKDAIESLFSVKVKSVNTLILKGKLKRFRGQLGRRRDMKKAYITLEDGNTIDINSGL